MTEPSETELNRRRKIRLAKLGAKNPQWRGDAAQRGTKRLRAHRLYPELGTCEWEGCKDIACDRHHIDGDTGNNERPNIQFLCRRHHMAEDGRLAVLTADQAVSGSKGGKATRKLTEAQVFAIRLSDGHVPGHEWASRFNISEATICRVRSFQSYAELAIIDCGRRKRKKL